MKKKTVVSVMVVAMLFAVSLYFVGGTYARYVGEFDGTSTVAVAAWNVALGGVQTEAENKFTLELSPEETDNVVEGKIAPSYSASGDITVNLTGTEVAVDLFTTIDDAKLKSALSAAGIKEDSIKTEVTVAGNGSLSGTVTGTGSQESPITIDLPDGQAFQEADTVKVTVKVTWDNKNDANSTEDTAGGKYAYSQKDFKLEIPVKLYAVQHIDSQNYTPAGA